MAVKTITIDLEAYTLLSRQKRTGESFSQVIKAHFGPQPTARRFLERLRSIRLEESTLETVDRMVAARKLESARAVKR